MTGRRASAVGVQGLDIKETRQYSSARIRCSCEQWSEGWFPSSVSSWLAMGRVCLLKLSDEPFRKGETQYMVLHPLRLHPSIFFCLLDGSADPSQ